MTQSVDLSMTYVIPVCKQIMVMIARFLIKARVHSEESDGIVSNFLEVVWQNVLKLSKRMTGLLP